MLRIGLTGGIGAGKSTAAARFTQLGALVIDHDQLARRAVEPGSAALVDITRVFGDRVVRDGRLDRAALAAIVFRDESARIQLNGIVHPYVFAMGRAEDRRARAQGVKVVVHDIPLLAEGDQSGDFDLVVTVAAAKDVRIQRLVQSRGMSRQEAQARMDAQATDEEREAIADVVLDGSGTSDELRAQVDVVWRSHIPS